MRVFVTGGTGFVGGAVIKQLVSSGHEVVALTRPGSEEKLARAERVKIHHGDINDRNCLMAGIADCDAVIHLVGIIRENPRQDVTFERLHVEATRNLVQAATLAGARRLVHMSSNGSRPDGATAYHRTKWRAEEHVRAAELEWTIIKPSIIFGPGGEFIEMLADLITKVPVVPVIGDGKYRMQPVAVEQVAETFVGALSREKTIGRSYELGGSKSYSYNEILDLTGRALGKAKVSKLHQPLFLIKPMVNLFEGISKFPITSDQLEMLLEGNECDIQPWTRDFGIEPLSYAEGIEACFSD